MTFMSTTFEVQCYVSEGVQRLRLWSPLSRIDPAFRREMLASAVWNSDSKDSKEKGVS